MDTKKLLWSFPIGMVVKLYTTFVIQNLWNWFVVTAFHVSSISFWGMYGLVLVVSVIADGVKGGENFTEEQRWKTVFNILDVCLPEDRKDVIKEKIEEQKEAMWAEIVLSVFAKLVGNTIMLGIGWFIHLFLV